MDDALLDALDDLAIELVGLTALALAQGGQVRDLTFAQWRALALIATGHEVRASDIAQRLGMSRPSVSRMIARLERKGLVVATTDPRDGRALILTSTPTGRHALYGTRTRRRQMVAAALDGRERPLPRDLRGGLRAVSKALDGAG